MTIAADTPIRRRPWPGYADPRLPTGMWVGEAIVTGDASGGLRFARLIFQEALAPQVSELWSLEQLSSNDTSNVSRSGTLQAINLDRVVFAQLWGLRWEAGPSVAAVRLEQLRMPLMLGGPARGGLTASLDVFLDNVDGGILEMQAQGYIWGARSRSTPGGPQRPQQGFFAN